MTKTTVVNIRDEPCDVLIDRNTDWGNPLVIGVDGTREEVIAKYRVHLKRRPDLRRRLHELKGRRLGCHCKPLACHGDVLAELADQCDDSSTTPSSSNTPAAST